MELYTGCCDLGMPIDRRHDDDGGEVYQENKVIDKSEDVARESGNSASMNWTWRDV